MNRDFDQEKMIDKMRSLRDKRDLELLNQSLEKINLNSDYQKKLLDNKLLNVKYIGKVEISGESKDIYLILEQKQNSDGNKVEIERYWTEDGEVLGGNNTADQYNFITLDERYLEQDGLIEELESLDKNGILDLNKIEKERLEQIAQELGVSVEKLEKISEIDPEKEWEKNEENQEIEEKKDKEDKEVLSKKQMEKIPTKQDIKTNQKVTDKDTMSSLLGVQGKGYTKIAIVYSDKFKDSGSTTRFSFVGINKDGSAEKIDTLEQAYSSNPTKKITTLNRDGSKVEEKQVNSIFKIKGKQEEQLAVDIGTMGTIEPSFVRTPRQDNQEAISIPIETSNIRPTTRETRELMNRSRNTNVNDQIDKAEEHEEAGCENYTLEDIDDNPNNNTHEHFEHLSDEQLNEYASKILENDKIASVYNRNDVIEKLKQTQENTENRNAEEILEDVEQEMEESAEDEHQLPQR